MSKSVAALTRAQKATILLAVDTGLVPLAMFLTYALFARLISPGLLERSFAPLVLVIVMTSAAFVCSRSLGVSRIKLQDYELSGILRTAVFAFVVGVCGLVGLFALFEGSYFIHLVMVFTMVLLILSVGVRIGLRTLLVMLNQSRRKRQRVLIYGAGQTGVQLASALGRDDAVMPVAYVDDNPTLANLIVAGLRVYPARSIESLINDLAIDRVVLAMPSISRPRQARISRRMSEIGCEVSVLPSFAALIGEGDLLSKALPANPADFLNRDKLDDSLSVLSELYEGRSVMITGAGGSIGAELVRQILPARPRRLVLLDLSEIALYNLGRELDEMGLSEAVEIELVLGSVLDSPLVHQAIKLNDVDVIFHAAAFKHVNLVERNMLSALRNNVLGTKIVAEAARSLGVDQFVLVSTDKAVHPASVMGASKRFAELVVQDLAERSSDMPRFSIVRFGNVLGSSGSVVPLFEEQITRGGPLTLTHEDVTRYFMTISEAARLVLLTRQLREDGQMFVLDMGQPVKIRRLAEQMIERAGYTVRTDDLPDGDIEILTIGLAKGEKLHEDLASDPTRLEPTRHPKIRRANENYLTELEMAHAVRSLTDALDRGSQADAVSVLNRWLNFRPETGKSGNVKPMRQRRPISGSR